MDVTQTTTAAQTANTTSNTAATSAISSDFETFLKMLTTQLQNQDPLNPIESTDYAVQLATFSGVEQQVKTNDLLENMGAQIGLMGMSQLAGWVGMEARVASDAHYYGAPITVVTDPLTGAETAKLVVRDVGGNEIQRIDLDPHAETFEWSGISDTGSQFLSGTYSFEVESYTSGVRTDIHQAAVYAEITEARAEASGTVLVMSGGIEVSADDVTALRQGG